MLRYVAWRLIQLPIILLAVYTVTFLLCSAAPGDPLYGLSDRRPNPEVLKERLREYGFDRPASQRYFIWLNEFLPIGWQRMEPKQPGDEPYWQFQLIKAPDLGRSFSNQGRPIAELIAPALANSMLLGAVALVICVLVGVISGVLAAAYRNGVLDYFSVALALVGISLPSFVVAAALAFVFCILLGWLPMRWSALDGSFGARAQQLVLPAIALALPYIAYISRLMRNSMIDALGQDFVRTARAKGCSPVTVIGSHAMRNAMLPVVGFLGPAAAGLLTGGFVVEKFFNVPGMADFFVNSVFNRDLRLLLVATLIYSVMLVFFNLLVDLAYGLIDPRIRRS